MESERPNHRLPGDQPASAAWPAQLLMRNTAPVYRAPPTGLAFRPKCIFNLKEPSPKVESLSVARRRAGWSIAAERIHPEPLTNPDLLILSETLIHHWNVPLVRPLFGASTLG